MHSQIEQLSLRQDQEMEAIAAENSHLMGEIMSKTQQVKQYKQEVDRYMKEAGAHKQYAEIQTDKV